MPSHDEQRATERAEAYMRSSPGTRLPPVKFIWVKDLEYINGATSRVRTPPPALIALRSRGSFEEAFLTCIHELQHCRDAFVGGYTEAQMEERAEAAVEQAMRERWRWWR